MQIAFYGKKSNESKVPKIFNLLHSKEYTFHRNSIVLKSLEKLIKSDSIIMIYHKF